MRHLAGHTFKQIDARHVQGWRTLLSDGNTPNNTVMHYFHCDCWELPSGPLTPLSTTEHNNALAPTISVTGVMIKNQPGCVSVRRWGELRGFEPLMLLVTLPPWPNTTEFIQAGPIRQAAFSEAIPCTACPKRGRLPIIPATETNTRCEQYTCYKTANSVAIFWAQSALPLQVSVANMLHNYTTSPQECCDSLWTVSLFGCRWGGDAAELLLLWSY